MTRTPNRQRPVILLCAAAAAIALLCGACTNGETVSTSTPATTGSTVVVSTTGPTTSMRTTTTTAPTTTVPPELARRALGTSTSEPFSPYAELEREPGDADGETSTSDAGTEEDAATESSFESADERADGASAALDMAEGGNSIGGQNSADESAPSTSTSARVPTTTPGTAPATTAKTTTTTTPGPSYVVTAVPTTVPSRTAGRSVTSSTSLAERTTRTTPPIFLPSPDRSSPTVRRATSTTIRRATTTSRPRTTSTTTTVPPTTTTTTAPPTTTTTAKPTIYSGSLGALDPNAPAAGRAGHLPPTLPASLAPLTGLPVTVTNARGAIVVKVDNAGPARPQSGLDIADIVYEERVEGSATRFAAVFHSTGSGSVGPIRSARSTDLGILGSFSRPAFVFSGANDEFRRLVAGQRIVDLGADVWGGYWRSTAKRAPYNLYAKLSTVWKKAPGVAPRPHFAYRAPGSAASSTASSASAITVAFDSNKVGYTWHASSGTWRRSQNGRAHNAASGARIAPENVVVQNVAHVPTGLTDVTGFPVVEARLVGSGSALVFTDGKVIRARWSKPSLASITTFVDTAGKAILLTPGRTWVELADPGSATWSP